MSYADGLLANGERVTLRERQHWLAILIDGRWGVLLIAFSLLLLWVGSVPLGNTKSGDIADTLRSLLGLVTLGAFLIGLGWLAVTVFNWFNEEYIVTNRRVLKVEGLLNKHAADSSLEKINDAVLDQNVVARLFGFGDLDIITANEDTVDRYRMLARAINFKKEMLNQKHDLEFEQMRPPVSPPLRATPPPPPPLPGPMTMSGDLVPPPPPMAAAGPGPATTPRTMTPSEVTQTLAGLADLRDRGAITPEEYEAKKSDLLGRL